MSFIGTFGTASGFTALEVDRSQQMENAFILYSEPLDTDSELTPKWITSRIVENFTLDTSIGGTDDQIFVAGQLGIHEGVIELPIRMGEGLVSTNQFRYLPAFNAFQYAVPRSTDLQFSLSDVNIEYTNYFVQNNFDVDVSVVLQVSRDNGRTFENTLVLTDSELLSGNINGSFTDTDGGTETSVLTGSTAVLTPHTDYMYRLILRLVRTDTNGNEDPDGSSTWRFRARIDPSLRLQATGNYNLLEGITVSDIGSWQGPDADSESTFTGSTLGLVSPGSNTVGGDNSVVVGVNQYR